jgi:hypothetical protein
VGFWEKQRVTVRGGAGFLGSYVTKKLEKEGASISLCPGVKIMTSLIGKPARNSIKIPGPISSST